MSNDLNKINLWFDKFDQAFSAFPDIIAETAVEHFKEGFISKSWEGVPWAPYKNKKREPKKGSLMMRTNNLFSSIRPSEVNPSLVTISAGSPKVPYARIHNEGGVINKAARSETFVRNRYTKGKKAKAFGGMGLYKGGTKAGKGLTFKAHSITMPQRQFMGVSASLNLRIMNRLKAAFNKE